MAELPVDVVAKNVERKTSIKKDVAILAVLLILAFAFSVFYQMPKGTSSNDIKKFSSLSELQSFVAASAGDYGYSGGAVPAGAVRNAAAPSDISGSVMKSASESASSGASDYSQTNIQVQGVDEADIVKNDGKYIYTVSGNKIAIVDAYPAENAKIASEIDFNGTVSEIFVNGDKLIVFGQEAVQYPMPVSEPMAAVAEMAASKMAGTMPYIRYSPVTSVRIYDISDKNNPALLNTISIDGNYYDSRMIDKYVYVIANEQSYYAYNEQKNVTLPQITVDSKCVSGNCASAAFPDVYYFENSPGNVFTTIAAINLDNPKSVSSKIFLTNYAQNMYVSEGNIYITYMKWMSEADYVDRMVEIILPLVPSGVQQKINMVMALDLSKRLKMQAVSEILENYTSSLGHDERNRLEQDARAKMQELEEEIAKEREKTVIQKISIGGGNIEYIANGEVPGNTLNQFSMDEHNGYFRIATTTSGNGGMAMSSATVGRRMQEQAVQTAASEAREGAAPKIAGMAVSETTKPSRGITEEEQKKIEQTTPVRSVPPEPQPSGPQNHVYVLDSGLNIVGKLEDLAAGERIYSVRFLGDKAYMVTFRQIDPLFVIDLSSPQNPKVLGYLKVPGVSDYLHPYDENHIIGLGRDATDQGRIKGMKISLFDVSDFENPKEISKYIIGDRGTNSEAIRDHKAFLFSREKNLLVIPVSEYKESHEKSEMGWRSNYWQGAYVFNIDLTNGITLKGKITHEKPENPENASSMRVEGKVGNALKFDGTDDYVNIGNRDNLNIKDAITVEAWVYWTGSGSDINFITSGGREQFELHTGGGGGSNGIRWIPTEGVAFDSGDNKFMPNQWNHLVATYDSATSAGRIYINGIDVGAKQDGSGALEDSSADFEIGRRSSGYFGYFYFNGKIDEVRAYNRILTPEEIKSRFSGNEIAADGLAGWWKFDETTGDSATDSSGKGNDGRITAYQKKYYYDYASEIRRSLYISNVLYTISQKMVMMNALENLGAVNEVELPAGAARQYPGVFY